MKNQKTCKSIFKFLSLLSISGLAAIQNVSALVDYTESSSFTPKNSGARRAEKATPAPAARVSSQIEAPRTRSARSGFFSAGLFYENDDIEVGDVSGTVSKMGVNTHFETPYNIYLDAKYYQAKLSKGKSDSFNSEKTSFQSGNPEVMIGFNWLEFGQAMDAAHIDLLAGLSFGQNNSAFATQRTDKIVGVATAKRFYDFALGLGYKMILTGDSDESELAIGNISQLSASLGWVVSQDIRFLVEANSYSIGRSTKETAVKLDDKVKVSVVSPQLILGISPLVDLTLGAHLSSRRLQQENLLGAKLWNIDGLYGNSLYVKMGFNL